MRELANSNCAVIGIDWNIEIEVAKSLTNGSKTLQGNLDPALLYSTTKEIKKATVEMLKRFGPGRHIANLGHGVYPDTPLENVKCFVDTVKEYRFE